MANIYRAGPADAGRQRGPDNGWLVQPRPRRRDRQREPDSEPAAHSVFGHLHRCDYTYIAVPRSEKYGQTARDLHSFAPGEPHLRAGREQYTHFPLPPDLQAHECAGGDI